MWKWLRRSPLGPLTGLSVFCGLLVDFQEAATRMSQIIPIIEALLPIVALGGTTLFGGLAVTSITSVIRRMLPWNRFGEHKDEIGYCLGRLTSSSHDLPIPTRKIYAELTDLTMTLDKFRIPYPTIRVGDPQYSIVWFNYLVILFSLARLRALKAARSPLSYNTVVNGYLSSSGSGPV